MAPEFHGIEIPRARIERFCGQHHIRRLALFGSILTDRFRSDSDVDVLVEFEREHVPGLFGIVEMDEFARDWMPLLSLVKELEIIGEAAGRVSPELKLAFPQVPWVTAAGMRSRLIHAYFDIRAEVVRSKIRSARPRSGTPNRDSNGQSMPGQRHGYRAQIPIQPIQAFARAGGESDHGVARFQKHESLIVWGGAEQVE